MSEKLGTLIEGESLFNDGSAIVVFEVFIGEFDTLISPWTRRVIGFHFALLGPLYIAFLLEGGVLHEKPRRHVSIFAESQHSRRPRGAPRVGASLFRCRRMSHPQK